MTVIALPAPTAPSNRHVLSDPIVRMLDTLCRYRKRAIYRKMLREELLLQPDSVIEDAGLDRDLASSEAHKPFWRA